MRLGALGVLALAFLATTAVGGDNTPGPAASGDEKRETWTVTADTAAVGAAAGAKSTGSGTVSFDPDFDGEPAPASDQEPAQGDGEEDAEPEEDSAPSTLVQLATMGAWVVALVGMWLGYLYMNQNNVLYHPEQPAGFRRPRDLPAMMRMGSPANRDPPMPFSNVFVDTPDKARIHVWLIHAQRTADRARVPTIVFLHGNAGNMGLRLPNTEAIYAACRGTVNIAMVDYRGYGESTGKPDEEGLGRDIDAVLRHLRTSGDVDPHNIFVFGRSLGGAVAVRGASGDEGASVRGLMLENTFTCVSDMVDRLMPSVSPVKGLVLRIYWPTEERLRTLGRVPCLFLSGSRDALIPPKHMVRNYKAHPGPEGRKHFVRVLTGEHNDTWQRGGWRYYAELMKFVRAHATPAAAALVHVPQGQWWGEWGRRKGLLLWRRARVGPALRAQGVDGRPLPPVPAAAIAAAEAAVDSRARKAAADPDNTAPGGARSPVEDVD